MNLTWPDANQVSYGHLEIATAYKDNELFLKPMFFQKQAPLLLAQTKATRNQREINDIKEVALAKQQME